MSGPGGSGSSGGGGSGAESRRVPGKPARERVTSVDGPASRIDALPRTGSTRVTGAESVFTRGLMRAQGRLAVAFVLAFVAVVAAITLIISRIPALHDLVLWGVPLPWLIQAYGYYPVIVVFAVAYTLAAMRAEHRFRALVERE